MMGYNPPLKGVDLALSAVGSLVADGLPLVLGIVGTQRLTAYLSERKDGACPWVRQIAFTDDIPSLYQAASVLLAPAGAKASTIRCARRWPTARR